MRALTIALIVLFALLLLSAMVAIAGADGVQPTVTYTFCRADAEQWVAVATITLAQAVPHALEGCRIEIAWTGPPLIGLAVEPYRSWDWAWPPLRLTPGAGHDAVDIGALMPGETLVILLIFRGGVT